VRFTDRVVIVTGASREGQMGAFLARAFGREGARVVLVARTAGNVAALEAGLRAEGTEAVGVAADLASEAGAAGVAARALDRFGRVDVLVNLAGGLTLYGPSTDLALADFQRELADNLTTAFLCSRAVLPAMLHAGRGRIVNFSSLAATSPGPRMLAYNCAKAGVSALTRTLALEVKATAITVNAVAPGLVETESNLARMKPSGEDRQAKWVTKEAVAEATLFLASDAAAGINGHVLAVAGRGA